MSEFRWVSGAALVAIVGAALGSDYTAEPRERSVIAIDLRSGQELWSRSISNGGPLYLDLAGERLLYREADSKNSSALRTKDGSRSPERKGAVVERSSEPLALGAVDLGDGLRFLSHRRGIAKFGVPRSKPSRTIEVRVASRPHQVIRHRDRILIAASGEIVSFDKTTRVQAWRFDLGRHFAGQGTLVSKARPSLSLWRNKLLVQAQRYLLVLNAQTGAVTWSDDAWKRLGVLWTREGSASSTITMSESIAVVAFPHRVVGFDIKRAKYLWNWKQDTHPFRTFPVADDKRVYLVGGKRRSRSVIRDG